MKFHAIGGLPRAGTTLLCNVLNQNPRFHASGTSNLSHILSTIAQIWSASPETKRDLANDKKDAESRMVRTARAIVEATYEGKEVVFDKGRGWGHASLILNQLFPDANLLLCVRDLRNVFASIEKEHRKYPLLDTAGSPIEKTIFSRADTMFSPGGLIGQPINGVEDILRRQPKNVVIVQYETLTQSPKLVMERIYSEIGESYFAHNFDNVTGENEDSGVYDAIHLNKFPHTVSGKIEPRDKDEWKTYLSDDVEKLIMTKFHGYNKAFGYA